MTATGVGGIGVGDGGTAVVGIGVAVGGTGVAVGGSGVEVIIMMTGVWVGGGRSVADGARVGYKTTGEALGVKFRVIALAVWVSMADCAVAASWVD